MLLLFVSMAGIITTLLFMEYRFFCAQTKKLILLTEQYQERVIEQEISVAQASDEPDDDDDYVDEPFIVINRDTDYLKRSTIDYCQDHDLGAFAAQFDYDQTHTLPAIHVSVQQKKNSINRAAVSTIQQKSRINVIEKKLIKDFGFIWPIERDKFWLSSLYGPRKRTNGTWGFHHGIDMAAVKGTVVKAVLNGKIVETGFTQGYGNTVVVEHTPDIKTRYAHLNSIGVQVGQIVQKGMVVGTVGETGFIRKKGKDGSHLHFEIYEKGKRIDPLQCLPRVE